MTPKLAPLALLTQLAQLALLPLVGCGWNHLPDQREVQIGPLWDPSGVIATAHGLYVPLTEAGAVALIHPDGRYETIDIGEGRVTRIDAAPDKVTVLAFVERYLCHADHPEEERQVHDLEDCPPDDVEVLSELSLLRAGEVISTQPVSGAYNRVAFSDDGKHAVAFLDLTTELDVDAVLNLTAVMVIDVEQGTSHLVPVGFATDRVLFVEDDAGAATRAVVVSRNQVGVVDLTADPADLVVTFPLTLDPDTVVDPIGVELTPDGRYALLSARGSPDLYALDLDLQAINIVELTGPPSAMAVDPGSDRTVLAFGGDRVVQLVDHDLFETETVDLDEPMTRVQLATDHALLWNDRDGHDLYRLDLTDDDLVEYRLQNPAMTLHVTPTEEFAVVLTRPESAIGTGVDGLYDQHPGMEIIDLRSDDTEPFLLVGDGLGVAFAHDDTHLNALVLQEGVDSLFRLDLYTRETEDIDLAAPPVAIGSTEDDRFWITHDQALGLISFLDPATGEIVESAGFAAQGILDPIELMEEEAR